MSNRVPNYLTRSPPCPPVLQDEDLPSPFSDCHVHIPPQQQQQQQQAAKPDSPVSTVSMVNGMAFSQHRWASTPTPTHETLNPSPNQVGQHPHAHA